VPRRRTDTLRLLVSSDWQGICSNRAVCPCPCLGLRPGGAVVRGACGKDVLVLKGPGALALGAG